MHPSRRPLVAGNWKMNKGGSEGLALASDVVHLAKTTPGVDVLIAPPFTVLAAIAHEIEGSNVLLAAQNMHAKAHGAFTGEVSAEMLLEAGCGWVILGHSERRHVFGEKDEDIALKVARAIQAGLHTILCVGETLAEREAGKTIEVVERQLAAAMGALAQSPNAECVAYEPVWAIGTGKTASPEDAEAVHAKLRACLVRHCLVRPGPGPNATTLGERTRILYGGSVSPKNAEALLGMPNVDGLLIGGASLEAASFGAIARTAQAFAGAS